MRAKRLDPDRAENSSFWDGDDVADAYQLSGLLGHDPVEDNSSGGAKARGSRPAFGKAREPQPLIEASARRLRRTHSGQVRFSSSNLANGCPSAVDR